MSKIIVWSCLRNSGRPPPYRFSGAAISKDHKLGSLRRNRGSLPPSSGGQTFKIKAAAPWLLGVRTPT